MSALTSILPAATGLAGVFAGLAAGEIRWRRERTVARGAAFLKRRQDAYAELWAVVEEAHVEARVALDEFNARRIAELTLRVNSYVLRNGVYIDDADRELAERYLRAVFTLVETIRSDGNPAERALLMTTARLSADFGRRVSSAVNARAEVDRLSELLRVRVRRELGAEFVDQGLVAILDPQPPERDAYPMSRYLLDSTIDAPPTELHFLDGASSGDAVPSHTVDIVPRDDASGT
jgi:hypothetical protein